MCGLDLCGREGLSVGSQLKCAQCGRPRRSCAISRIRNVSRARKSERERERGRLSTSFCWICLIKNDRRQRRRSRSRGRGERREGKLSWQAAYGSYFAPFRQLSVAEAPQEVARVACCRPGLPDLARSGNLSCCCVIVREKCANRAQQQQQKPSEALRPALPLLFSAILSGQKVSLQVCLLYESQVAASGKLQVAFCVRKVLLTTRA